jgi:hypothetical protein
MFFTLFCAGTEALVSLLMLVGVRKDPALYTHTHTHTHTHTLDEPLLGGDIEEGKGDNEGGDNTHTHTHTHTHKEKEKKKGASVGRLLSLSKPERGLIVLGRCVCVCVFFFFFWDGK